MPSKGNADLAHPQAADWVMGTVGPDEAVGFQLHLSGCPHCQAAVAEFGQLGQMLQHLPPAAEPPPGLEARTMASVLAAAAEDRTSTKVHQIPGGLRAEDQTATKIHHVPRASPAASDTSSSTQASVIRFPRWPGRAGLLAIAGAAAAAIIAAVIVLPGLGGGLPKGAFAFKLVSPRDQGTRLRARRRPGLMLRGAGISP
jgi:hypothetical protein